MKIIRMKNKTKIVLEYSNKSEFNFDTIDSEDCNMKVFLKNGKVIYRDAIDYITINAKKIKGVR